MVSKRWQFQNKLILNSTLAACCLATTGTLYLVPTLWLRIAIIVAANMLFVLLGRFLHRRYAHDMVRVFVMEFEDATYIVQRALNNIRVPFNKRTKNGEISFQLRNRDVELRLEEFPLNLPVDSNLKTVDASKITLTNVSDENLQLITSLRNALDDAFTYVVKRRENTVMSFGD